MASLAGHRWSVAWLLRWAFLWVLATVLGTAMVAGPLLADFAWDHEAHVTPTQAALHFALAAQNLVHHHAAGTPGAASEQGTTVSQPGPGLTFGAAVGAGLIPSLSGSIPSLVMALHSAALPLPVSFAADLETPPPR